LKNNYLDDFVKDDKLYMKIIKYRRRTWCTFKFL